MTITALATEISSDHDGIVHPAAMSTSHALAMARADIHDAVAAVDDDHRRRQYALSARDNAAEALTAPGATRAELEYASNYLADAEAIIAATGADAEA